MSPKDVIKNVIEGDNTRSSNDQLYIPSSSEKKRAMVMYFFIGIMVYISKKEVSPFELYHLKQASGRWLLFIFVLVAGLILLFIPIIKIIFIMIIVLFIVARLYSIKQARSGEYQTSTKNNSPLGLFLGVGNWFITLFEVDVKSFDTTQDAKQNDISDIPEIEQDISQQGSSLDSIDKSQ